MKNIRLVHCLALAVPCAAIAGAGPTPPAHLVRIDGHLCHGEQILLRWKPDARIKGKPPGSCSKALLHQALELPTGATLVNNPCAAQLHEAANRTRITSTSGLDFSTFQVLRLQGRLGVAEALKHLSGHPLLAYAEPDGFGSGSLTPNDPNFGLQWHHQIIDSTNAWARGEGPTNVILAVLDTGLNTALPEFAGRTVPGYDFANNDANPADDQGHGTAVAGAAAATGNNATLVAGMTWGSRIMPVKVLDANNFGYYSWWAAGIDYAVANGAKVINLSAGGGQDGTTLRQSVLDAVAAGAIFVTVAGNSGAGSVSFPGRIPEAIALGATDQSDNRWSSSNWGPEIDLVAPGVTIYTVSRGGGLVYYTGTSVAAPLVSGTACLIASYLPAITQTEMLALLTATADDQVGGASDTPGFDIYHGWGRLNAGAALTLALESLEPPEFDLTWGASAGLFFPSPSHGVLPHLGDEALAQLYFAPDNVIDEQISAGGATTGNDVVIDSIILRNNGSAQENFAQFQRQFEWIYQEGTIYGVLFASAMPAANERYYRGPGMATSASAMSYDLNTDTLWGDSWNGTVTGGASVYVGWTASAGFIDDQGNPILPNLGDKTLAQLIYSPDGVADNLHPQGIPDNDDVVLDARIITNDGGLWEDYGLFGYQHYRGALQQGGYVYGVVYEDPAPTANEPLYAGPMEEVAGGAVFYELNTDFVNGNHWNGVVVGGYIDLMWGASVGFVDDQGDPILPTPGNEARVQLVFSPDGVADVMLPGGVPADNDVVVYSGTEQNSGGALGGYCSFGPLAYNDAFQTGFVYGVIYENNAPVGGDRYYQGPLQATAESTGPPPDAYEMNRNLADGDAWNRTVANNLPAQIPWAASAGFIDDGGNPILPALNDETVAILIYSPDNVADPILPGGIPGGNDVVLDRQTVRNSGGLWENYGLFGPIAYTGYLQAGFVHGAIFEDDDPQAGDQYYVGPQEAMAAYVSHELNTDFVNGNMWNSTVLGQSLALDFDDDGLPNDFEMRHFDDYTSGVPTIDSDLDGVLNIAEYLADTDPEDPDSFFGVTSFSQNGAQSTMTVRDTSLLRNYRCEYNDTMHPSGPWIPLGAAIPGTGGDTAIVESDGPPPASRVYRANVLLP